MSPDAMGIAFAGLAVGLTLAALVAAGRARWHRWRSRRRVVRGKRLEAQAPAHLAREGFRVVASQPAVDYSWLLDDEIRTTRLTADFLAVRRGRRYVVEVKSGAGATPERRATRRQLLEYAVAYPVDGVLLFDAEQDRLRRVDFPLHGRSQSGLWWFLSGLVAGIAAAWLSAAH